MALRPQNEDAFLREVDEELRRDQMTTFWHRWGIPLVALVLAGLLAFGGWLWWQDQRQKAADLAAENFTAAIEAVGKGQDADAISRLDALASGKEEGYRVLARLALAAHKLENDDAKGAAAAYGAIAADEAVAQPFRDLALVRQTAAEFDALPPKTVIDRLAPLAVSGNPWFGSAGEMTAIAWLKLGQEEKAASLFAAIAAEKDMPETLKGRAVRIAGALGADVTDAVTAGRK